MTALLAPERTTNRVDERELVARVISGEPRAQRELYDSHVDRVYRLAYRLAGEDELARDFTQLTFIRAFQRIAEFRYDSSLATWLHAIGVSVALNGLRTVKKNRQRNVPLEAATGLGTIGRSAEPDLTVRLA